MNKGVSLLGLFLIVAGIVLASYTVSYIDRSTVSNVGVDLEIAEIIWKYDPDAEIHVITPDDDWDYKEAGRYFKYGRANAYPYAVVGAIVVLIGLVAFVIGTQLTRQ